MATSSIPGAMDFLVTQIAALPECAAPVVVSDGWPAARSDKGVAIGITPDDPATEVPIIVSQLGADMEREMYDIPCCVWAKVGGTDQKAARDAAFAIYNAILTRIRTKPPSANDGRTLGGLLKSGYASIRGLAVFPTHSVEQSGEGRICELRFVIHCENRF